MNSSYKYLASAILSFLICLFLYIGLFYFQLGIPTYLSVGIERLYLNKNYYAEHINEPKLVILSGSTAHYGIRCQTIQKEMGLGCINGGTHVGLGIEYLLYRGRTWLKPGDIVLLPLEYKHYKSDGVLSDILIDYVMAFDPEYLNLLDWNTRLNLVMSTSISRLFEGIINRLTQTDFKESYQYEKLLFEGKNGDNDQIIGQKTTQKLKQFIEKIDPLDLADLDIQTAGMNSIAAFLKWCQERDILVLATWPNTIWFDAYESQKTEHFFKTIIQFYQNLGVPVLGLPQDFMYEKDLFYDSIYHLNNEGIEIRTQQTLTLLKRYLAHH
jgi:hypothetical protein